MRVCLYQRISTDEDHQPTSLKTQLERLERYCEAMEDWRIVAAYEDQASGTSLDRPGLQQALDLAREKRIDLLLVYRVDRLSRKVRQLAALCEELDQLDVVLKSATEPFDTGSPAGRMMLQMLGVFAEFEHATIVDRVTAGLERRVREGKWMSGRTPYGYERDKDTKLLVPDEVKAPVVRRIFDLYAEGKLGTTAIARTLEAEGAPPPRKHGWSPNALQLILANPAYRGLVRWNGETHPGLHQPLVDDDTFDKAQEILRRRGEDASLRRGNPSDYHSLRPSPLPPVRPRLRRHHAHGRNGRYTYYACSTRYKYGPTKCNGDRLPKDRLEAAVLTQLAELYRDGHVIERALADLANVTESERPEFEEQLASTRAEIARVESKLERYFEGFEEGRLAAELFQDRVRGHRDRLEILREREADLTARLAAQAHTPPDGAALQGLADQLEAIVANENPEQAKELLRLLVKDIQVHDRRRIIPTYRIPAAVRAIPRKVGGTGLEPADPLVVEPALSQLSYSPGSRRSLARLGGRRRRAVALEQLAVADSLRHLLRLRAMAVPSSNSITGYFFCPLSRLEFGALAGQPRAGTTIVGSTPCSSSAFCTRQQGCPSSFTHMLLQRWSLTVTFHSVIRAHVLPGAHRALTLLPASREPDGDHGKENAMKSRPVDPALLAAGAVAALVVAGLSQAASPPVNQSPPTISGTPQVGQTLTADVGKWGARPRSPTATNGAAATTTAAAARRSAARPRRRTSEGGRLRQHTARPRDRQEQRRLELGDVRADRRGRCGSAHDEWRLPDERIRDARRRSDLAAREAADRRPAGIAVGRRARCPT